MNIITCLRSIMLTMMLISSCTVSYALVTSSASTVAVSNGLVGYWTFDGKYLNTSTSTDSSGRGNNGTLTNSPPIRLGKLGQALLFNGSSQYILLSDNPFDLTDLSIAVWVKTSQVSRGTVIGKGTTGDYQYALEVNKTEKPNKVSLTMWTSAGVDYLTVASNTTINDGKWHHVVGIVSGTIVRVYVDGILENVSSTTSGTRDTSGAAVATIGRRADAVNYFNGTMDDVRMYNRALSQAEVTVLYKLGGR